MPKRKTESRTNYAGAVRSRADTSYHCIRITFHKWNKLNLLDLDLCYSVKYACAVRSRADTSYHCIGIIWSLFTYGINWIVFLFYEIWRRIAYSADHVIIALELFYLDQVLRSLIYQQNSCCCLAESQHRQVHFTRLALYDHFISSVPNVIVPPLWSICTDSILDNAC